MLYLSIPLSCPGTGRWELSAQAEGPDPTAPVVNLFSLLPADSPLPADPLYKTNGHSSVPQSSGSLPASRAKPGPVTTAKPGVGGAGRQSPAPFRPTKVVHADPFEPPSPRPSQRPRPSGPRTRPTQRTYFPPKYISLSPHQFDPERYPAPTRSPGRPYSSLPDLSTISPVSSSTSTPGSVTASSTLLPKLLSSSTSSPVPVTDWSLRKTSQEEYDSFLKALGASGHRSQSDPSNPVVSLPSPTAVGSDSTRHSGFPHNRAGNSRNPYSGIGSIVDVDIVNGNKRAPGSEYGDGDGDRDRDGDGDEDNVADGSVGIQTNQSPDFPDSTSGPADPHPEQESYRLTTERLAYILIGSCCALSILCLIIGKPSRAISRHWPHKHS